MTDLAAALSHTATVTINSGICQPVTTDTLRDRVATALRRQMLSGEISVEGWDYLAADAAIAAVRADEADRFEEVQYGHVETVEDGINLPLYWDREAAYDGLRNSRGTTVYRRTYTRTKSPWLPDDPEAS